MLPSVWLTYGLHSLGINSTKQRLIFSAIVLPSLLFWGSNWLPTYVLGRAFSFLSWCSLVICLRKYQINISFIATFFVIASLLAKPSSTGGRAWLPGLGSSAFLCLLEEKAQWERCLVKSLQPRILPIPWVALPTHPSLSKYTWLLISWKIQMLLLQGHLKGEPETASLSPSLPL